MSVDPRELGLVPLAELAPKDWLYFFDSERLEVEYGVVETWTAEPGHVWVGYDFQWSAKLPLHTWVYPRRGPSSLSGAGESRAKAKLAFEKLYGEDAEALRRWEALYGGAV